LHKIIILILLITLTPFQGQAFNWKNCKESIKTTGANIFTAVSATSAAVGSYISSTGECSVIGMSHEEEMKHYVLKNSEQMKKDVARGNGEYLDTFLEMTKCPQVVRTKLIMKEKFSTLFAVELDDKNYAEFYKAVDNICYDYSYKAEELNVK